MVLHSCIVLHNYFLDCCTKMGPECWISEVCSNHKYESEVSQKT
jgi:hypothetical protein